MQYQKFEQTSVNLSNCNINDEGVDAIVQLLKTNTALVELDLSDNHITDIGAKKIAEVLSEPKRIAGIISGNVKFARLNLAKNQIGLEGRIYLLEMLIPNTSLTALGVTQNTGKVKVQSDQHKIVALDIQIGILIQRNILLKKSQQHDLLLQIFDEKSGLSYKHNEMAYKVKTPSLAATMMELAGLFKNLEYPNYAVETLKIYSFFNRQTQLSDEAELIEKNNLASFIQDLDKVKFMTQQKL